jgi:hypothetical protein
MGGSCGAYGVESVVYRVLMGKPAEKRPVKGRGADHPPTSSADVKKD